MRRIAATALVLVSTASLLAFGTAAKDDGAGYEVRAIFDNGAFLVPGVDVRVAGANVGSVSEVDVTGTDEAAHADGSPDPGKAVAVLDITDEAFQDFREDATCTIRPQSLLGDKFVECKQTQPHAASSELPPPLKVIADGEPGEGQRLLPVERNSKVVDLDLVNNIMREPYPDRFRLILNDLGAGVAARGEDLDEIIERANPALRETDEVLAILAEQNRELERLAVNGDESLQPLAAERRHVSGFINNAETTAAATAERSAELEAQFQKLPGFLRELRLTMEELDAFATQSAPVVSDLGDAAPDLTRATVALEPFADAATPALRTLGTAAEQAGPNLVASEPVIHHLGRVARGSLPSTRTLEKLLISIRKTEGGRRFARLIYFATGALNGFDSFGHLLRALVPVNNCYGYDVNPEPSCESFFTRGGQPKTAPKESGDEPDARKREARSTGEAELDAGTTKAEPSSGGAADLLPPLEFDLDVGPEEEQPTPEDGAQGPPQTASSQATPSPTSVRMLLDYLVGPAPEAAEEAGR